MSVRGRYDVGIAGIVAKHGLFDMTFCFLYNQNYKNYFRVIGGEYGKNIKK